MSLPYGLTQRDIAQHLGISISTVSRALNDNARISPATREAVQRAIRELSLPTSASAGLPVMIGVTHSHAHSGVQSPVNESILDQVLGGIEVACRGHNAVPYPWQQSSLLASPEADSFFDRIAGVITTGGEIDDVVVDGIRAHGTPLVIVGGHLPGTGIPSVAADNMAGLYKATQHLLQLGHRRIALINGPDTTYTSREKKAGYLAAFVDSGAPFAPELLVARDDRTGLGDQAAEALTRQVLALENRPTALLFGTDVMARAGFRVCQELGLSIPGDISTIGFHDDVAEFTYPPMTSVRVNRFAWGVAAVEELLRIIDGQPGRESRLLLPVELIVRESTGPCRRA